MKKNFLIKAGAMTLAFSLALGAGIINSQSIIFAQESSVEDSQINFNRPGIVKLEYQVDGGTWKKVPLKMKTKLREPEVSISAQGTQEIELLREYLGKPIKFRADFIETTEEGATPKLISEELRVFDGISKEDIDVLKYTYESENEEENEATYSLSSAKVKGINNSIMNVNIVFGETESGVVSEEVEFEEHPTEEDFSQITPNISFTNIIENYAVAGEVVARLSLPNGVNDENVEYKFDETNTNFEAKKIRDMFEIVGNEVRIRNDFDTYEFGDSAIESRTITDRVYNDGKRHIKEGREFWLGFYAEKNGVKSSVAYTYEGTKSKFVIGKHIEEVVESNNQFIVTKLEYYLGDKGLSDVTLSEWKKVDDNQLEKINSTSGHLGTIADGYVAITTSIDFKEVNRLKLYIKVSTDKVGSTIYNNKNSDKLISDITDRGVKEKDGRVYGVISVVNGTGNDEIWRSFNIKVYPSIAPFKSYLYENVKISAEEGVLPDGARITVVPVVADELNLLKEKLGEERLNTYISAEDIKLINYAGEEITVPAGKEVTVGIAKPSKIKNDTIKVYHIVGDTVEEKSTTLDEEGYIVFKANSFSPYVIVAESTVGTEEGDKEDEMPVVNVDETENNTGNDGEVPTTSEETPAVEPGATEEKPIVEPSKTEEKPNSETDNDKGEEVQGSEEKTVTQNGDKGDNLPKTGIEDDITYTLCLLIPIVGLAVCGLLALKKKNI